MTNMIAIAMLLPLSLVMVLSPKPILVMSLSDGNNVLKSAKKVAQEMLNVEEMGGTTKDTLVKGMEGVTKPMEKSIGWFQRKPKSEDHLSVAKEKTILAKEAMQEADIELKDATLEKLSSTIKIVKEKVTDTYHETENYVDEKTSQIMEAAKNVVENTEELAKDGACNVYNKARFVKDATYNIANAGRDKVGSTIQKTEVRAEEVVEDAYNIAAETFESTKDKTYEKVGGARDRLYDAVGYMKEKLQDIVVGAKDEIYDTSITKKDKTSRTLEFSKNKVYEGVGRASDAIVDNVQPRLDKTKEVIVDASDKAKMIEEHATHNMKEVGHGFYGKVKDVACKTAECLREQSYEAGSFLHNSGQGVGSANNGKRVNGDDVVENLKKTTSNTNENIPEMGENAKAWTKNSVNSAIKPTKQFYDNVKNKADYYYYEGKDRTREKYDSAKDTIQDYYPEVGRRSRDIRDYYDRSNDYYKSKGGRQYYKGARDVHSRSYYDVAKDKGEDYYDGIKDKTRHVFKGTKDGAEDYQDNVRDKMNGYHHDRHEEGSRSYYSTSKQRSANGYHNAHDTVEDYYENTKFKPGKDLGAMVESMGWHRTGTMPSNRVPHSSSDEVMIGNIKYAWHGKGQPPTQETIFKHMSNTVKDATHNVGEKVGLIKEHAKDGVENVQDATFCAKDQAHDTFQDDRLQQMGHKWPNHQSNYPKYEHDINGKEDDYIITKGKQNLKEGKQNARYANEAQKSKLREYADLAQQELLSFMGYGKGKMTLEGGRNFHSKKDVFFKRPVGILLLFTRILHLFTFSTVYGSSFWVTFVSGIILSKHIPRQQFGYVQSRIFPIYLRILVVGQSILFILHFIMHPWFSVANVERCQLFNFGLMIASTLINAYVLEPRATKIMFEQLKVEKEEGRGLDNVVSPIDAKQLMEEHKKKLVGINQQFKALHGYSSALNLITLGGLTCHLWHLAHRLII